MEAAVEQSRTALAAGQGLDVVLTKLDEAAPSTILLIRAFREVTGLGLDDALKLIEEFRQGTSLAHLRAARVALLRLVTSPGGDYGHWLRGWFMHAVVHHEPMLTVTAGPSTPMSGCIYHRFGNSLVDGNDATGGSLSGPGISFDVCRAEAHHVAASEHPLGRRLSVEDFRDAFICRFLLD
jgi:hypothetical protein